MSTADGTIATPGAHLHRHRSAHRHLSRPRSSGRRRQVTGAWPPGLGGWRAVLVGLSTVVCLVACEGAGPGGRRAGDATTSTDGAAGQPTKRFGDRSSLYLEASDQTSDGRSVTVDEVVLNTPGWVALHEHSHGGGSIGAVVGVSGLLAAGTSRNVTVTFHEQIAGAITTVYPMLHVENTNNTVFDFPEGDGEASLPGVGVVVLPIRVTVP